MLIDNKFIYISLPRCGSTSMLVSCLKQKINVKYVDYFVNKTQINTVENIDINTIDENDLSYRLLHGHEPINHLEDTFGYDLDIIAVKRNKYTRFISLWQHIIDLALKAGDITSAEKMQELDETQILNFKVTTDKDEIGLLVKNFMQKYGLNENNIHLSIQLRHLFLPLSTYHKFYKKIIWFDIENLSEMENWISNKLNRKFKLLKVNSSSTIECNLKLTDSFKTAYDNVFFEYDEPKIIKTFT